MRREAGSYGITDWKRDVVTRDGVSAADQKKTEGIRGAKVDMGDLPARADFNGGRGAGYGDCGMLVL